ncbi:hypothetical protein MCOR27_001307 [Pyricularia oryzae]|uniref:WW domain-containing protein n=1 Tax=Pyricularia grisea TaxID=148305 RepID=A0ABQ8NTF1_PYRGI|nr:hypothetical protein MCOR27_001307 [Pyricularia oryzae]KAI6301882.1 hypothetical protein MCOR33_002722 [Pyricularia grisea]KAI6343139.1 hypothetical protein MCOR30_001579 [Pyricularia oryzae]KAI6472512.1 hypothetical protein MCOR18_008517 [Pyricularia oryzae]KAI6529470.1 hypothetical protein MCOR05_008029 [Pyricularia oryzae]
MLLNSTTQLPWLRPPVPAPRPAGLPWPWEFQHDDKTSSWLNPAKLDLFMTHGTLQGNIYDGCGEGAYCFVEDKTVHGDSYWANYTVGKVGGPGRPEEAPAPGA